MKTCWCFAWSQHGSCRKTPVFLELGKEGVDATGSGGPVMGASVSSSLGMSHLTQEGPCGLAVPHKTSRRRRNFPGMRA